MVPTAWSSCRSAATCDAQTVPARSPPQAALRTATTSTASNGNSRNRSRSESSRSCCGDSVPSHTLKHCTQFRGGETFQERPAPLVERVDQQPTALSVDGQHGDVRRGRGVRGDVIGVNHRHQILAGRGDLALRRQPSVAPLAITTCGEPQLELADALDLQQLSGAAVGQSSNSPAAAETFARPPKRATILRATLGVDRAQRPVDRFLQIDPIGAAAQRRVRFGATFRTLTSNCVTTLPRQEHCAASRISRSRRFKRRITSP